MQATVVTDSTAFRKAPVEVARTQPDAAESIEFVNTAALVLRHMGKFPKGCRIIDER